MENWITVAKIRDAHGLKGELFVVPLSKTAEWMEGLDSLQIVLKTQNESGETQESVTDHQITRSKPHKVGLIVKLVGVEDRNEAERLRGARIRIQEDHLRTNPGENFYLKEIEGFEIQTAKEGVIGKIVAFSSNGPQDLLVVEQSNENKVEIPLVDDFIEEILWEKRIIQMNLPEGILEV